MALHFPLLPEVDLTPHYKNVKQYDHKTFTYGLEVEASDFEWGKKKLVPEGGYFTSELDIVHSDGRAFSFDDERGGELNTHPTTSIDDQIATVEQFNQMYPEATVNHRIKLHTWVGIPGLIDDVDGLKRLLRYGQQNVPVFMDLHFNFDHHPSLRDSGKDGGLWWRYLRADRTVMPNWRFKQIMEATNPDEFFRNHMLKKNGEFCPPQAHRYGLNFLTIKKIGALEFRTFFASLDTKCIRSALEYSRDFVVAGLNTGQPVHTILAARPDWVFPPECKFNPWLEEQFRKTYDKEAWRKKVKYVLMGVRKGGSSATYRPK